MSDIENFLCNPVRNKGILLFPPVSKYRRFLIHKLIEESFSRHNLQTLSVGKDTGRRTAVFLRSLLRPDFKVPETPLNQPGRQRHLALATPMVNKNGDKNKARTPYGGIYRPPAVRRLLDSKLDLKEESDAACDAQPIVAAPVESAITIPLDMATPVSNQTQQVAISAPPATCSSEKKSTRVKRPDRQMYVPRPKRLSTKDENLPGSERTDKSDLQPRNKVFISERRNRVKVRKKSECENGTKDECSALENMADQLINPAEERAADTSRVCESSEFDESAEISSVEPSLTATEIDPSLRAEEVDQSFKISYVKPSLRAVEIDQSSEISAVELSSKAAEIDQSFEVSSAEPSFSSLNELAFETSQSILSESTDAFDSSFQTCPEASFSIETENCQVPDVELSENSLSVPSNLDFDSSNSVPDQAPANIESTQVPALASPLDESREISEANCENNEAKLITEDANFGVETPNSSLMSFSSLSDSGSLANLTESPEIKCSRVTGILDTSAESEDKDSPVRRNLRERAMAKSPEAVADDWELLLNESGQFFDPSLLKELEEAVGKVNISRPSCDYKEFQTVEERTSDGECIIEIYGFSSELRTHDLMNIFSPLCGKNFQIAWVDDTHALGVFPSPLLADELLSTELPFVRTRPLSEGIPESRFKARKLVLPPMTRPKTCPALARRLVTGALGLRLPTSKLEREAERKVLKEARDKKRQEAKIRRDIWEGN